MQIKFYLKTIFFIVINSIFLFQEIKPYGIENRLTENNSIPQNKLLDLKIKKQNFFSKNKINPLSIFLTFENNQNSLNDKNEFLIESNEQIESQDSFIAKGNVIIKYKSATLKTDFIKYSKSDSTIVSEGNIEYQNNNQFIQADKFIYNLNNKSGSIENVYGIMDITTITEDLNWDSPKTARNNFIKSEVTKTKFESKNIIGLSIGKDLSDEDSDAKVTINSLKKWRFQSPEVLVNDQLLSMKRASFTNDPFNPVQLTLESYNLRSKRSNGRLILISPWTKLKLDNKLSIPLARRTFKEGQENLQKWGFGFDYEEKDGFYLSRNSDQFEIYNIKYRFVNEFYLQRIFENRTNVFREKNASITSEPIENKINNGDYFGFKFLTNSDLLGYEFNTSTSLNSLNTNRLSEALRHESTLAKVIDFKNIKNINNNIFFVYRNKIDTGYEGVKEIYTSIGTNFEKDYKFKLNNLDFNSKLRLQLANFKSEELNGKNLISKNRISTVGLIENRYNIWTKKNPDFYIDKTYKYTPLLIDEGLDWVTRLIITSSIYEDHNSQNIIKFELGPEINLGNLKKKTFDYTSFKAVLGLFEKNGDSPFKFDNLNESERIYLELKQQIYGPLIFAAEVHYNIDKNSSDFNKFVNPKYTLSFNRRAYNFELYTIPDRKISGFNFNIYGLGYEGYGNRFKEKF